MKKQDLEQFFKKAKTNKLAFEGHCHKCNCPVTVKVDIEDDGKLTIVGGAVYYSGQPKALYFKCDKCFAKNSELRNFQPCLVYSRVVGFYRPVGDWNEGKQAEFKARKTFNIPGVTEIK